MATNARNVASILAIIMMAGYMLLRIGLLANLAEVSTSSSQSEKWAETVEGVTPEISRNYTLDNHQLPLPKPILVVGLPKTGTLSLAHFFKKAGYRTSHWKCAKKMPCGLCIPKVIKNGLPPLKTCGNYEVWAQMDVENGPKVCKFPQINNLDAIHEEAPNATFLLSTRNLTNWALSATNWMGGARKNMAKRLASCPDGPKSPKFDDLIAWHKEANDKVREFVKLHPSHALVEVDIEHPDTGEQLAHLFQTKAKYWANTHKSTNSRGSKMGKKPNEKEKMPEQTKE